MVLYCCGFKIEKRLPHDNPLPTDIVNKKVSVWKLV